MTNFDFLKSVVDGTITDDVKTKAAELLEKEEARLAKAAEKKAEKAAADDEMIEAILGILTEEPQTASDIFTALGEEVIPSAQKVSSLFTRKIIPNGLATAEEIKTGRKYLSFSFIYIFIYIFKSV